MRFCTLSRYFHTLRYIRPLQVAARARYKLRRPRLDLRAAPRPRQMPREYRPPIGLAPTLIGPDVFRFLNVERRCAAAQDWRPADVSKLWVYNLHYFDDLNSRDAAARARWHRVLLERWVAENPPGSGHGWEPYPVSRRAVNWVKWAAQRNVLPLTCRASLAAQVRWLVPRLEYHLLGNHLLANAKALIYAGLYFEGDEAERWHARGCQIIARQLREQVLPDGGHFELSTMYHAAVLEDLLDLVNVSYAFGLEPAAEWLIAIAKMRRWLITMCHPDGEIPFFNDAAFGVTPTPGELEGYALRLGLPELKDDRAPLVVLEASGYVRALAGSAHLICDCAAVGPDYLPGHGHADTLSFELSLGERRIFVNSGTSQYCTGTERERQRGTAAHNTVVIDGSDSTEVWGSFRVARRARARIHRIASTPQSNVIEASHDGYRRLPGRNVHRRRWILAENCLRIEDEVSGEFGSAEARFHVHPAVEVNASGEHEVEIVGPGALRARVHFEGASKVQICRTTWHPYFGVSVANCCVVARFLRESLVTRVHWIVQA